VRGEFTAEKCTRCTEFENRSRRREYRALSWSRICGSRWADKVNSDCPLIHLLKKPRMTFLQIDDLLSAKTLDCSTQTVVVFRSCTNVCALQRPIGRAQGKTAVTESGRCSLLPWLRKQPGLLPQLSNWHWRPCDPSEETAASGGFQTIQGVDWNRTARPRRKEQTTSHWRSATISRKSFGIARKRQISGAVPSFVSQDGGHRFRRRS
jgi:hypothetical protein